MKKNKSFYLLIIGILVGIFAFSGCTNHNNSDAKNIQQDTKDPTPEKFSVVESQEPTLTEVDWSNYFEGLTGTAIVYDPTEKNYMIYNKELALTQRSPCSTFKIISSLIGLENGIIDPIILCVLGAVKYFGMRTGIEISIFLMHFVPHVFGIFVRSLMTLAR